MKTAHVNLEMSTGRFKVKTLSSPEELQKAFALRYQVFQVEMIGTEILTGEDQDEFDLLSDHLAIYDTKTDQMIATCRLNCSLFSNRFYSEQEFKCASLMNLTGTKLEIGRVCVHHDFRKGVVVLLLWRALAEYMDRIKARFLFGCGSVATLDVKDAVILYRYLEEEGKVRNSFHVSTQDKFRSMEFDHLLSDYGRPLKNDEKTRAQSLLPSLCRSYFDIGCFTPGPPAFDYEFKCIDFLTVLDVNELAPNLRRKFFGET